MKGKTFKKRVLSIMMVLAMLLSVVAAYVVPIETALADEAPFSSVAIAGNFKNLAGSGLDDWSEKGGSDGAGLMEYLGNGYYYKKITFDELQADYSVQFKITFNGSWEGALGAGDKNIEFTIPKGSENVEFAVDTAKKLVYNSIEDADAVAAILKGNEPEVNQDIFKDITIRFENTQNWDKVNAYFWPNGSAWPGTELTKVGDYYVWTYEDWNIENALNIIFNGGGTQTVDLSIQPKEFAISTDWIFTPSTKNGDKWECDKVDKAPHEIAVIAGNFDTFPNCEQSNWNPAGGSNGEGLMEYLGKGYYYKKITFGKLTEDKLAEFKAVFGGAWDTEGQFGNGGDNYKITVPTGLTYVDIIADVKNQKIYTSVDSAETVYSILAEFGIGKEPEVEEDPVKDIVVRFENTQNWGKVKVHIWGSGGTGTEWPGVDATKDGDVWTWSGKWDTSKDFNMLFHNGEGTQTVDLAIKADELANCIEWTFIPTSNESGKWECKKVDKAPYEIVAVAGDFNNFPNCEQTNWNPSGGSNGEGLMEYVGKGYYYKKITFDKLDADKAAGFKIVPGGNWGKDFGVDGDNYVITVPAGSTYVEIVANVNDKKIYTSVENPEAIEAVLKGEDPVDKPAEMAIINNKVGTTTFVAVADENKKVTLYYGAKSEVEANGTSALKSAEMKPGKKGEYVSDELFLGDAALDYVFYYDVEGTRVLNDKQETVTIGDEKYSRYTRKEFTGRKVNLPGGFPDASWLADSHEMTYVGNGLYKYTYKNLAAAIYEYKVAIDGAWTENYGDKGVHDGGNIKVTVPTTQDVTFYYSDFSHYTVNSIDYVFADITLVGSGIEGSLKVTDDELTGIYSVTVKLAKGEHTGYKLVYEGNEYVFNTFELAEEKDVTFFFDPVTKVYYHNGSNTPVSTENIYYTTKDKAYKSVYGAVEQNKDVTFTIETGEDATAVTMIVKGVKSLPMTKSTKVDGVQKWTVTASFNTIGEFDYYFTISNGATIVVYGDDNGAYAGEGEVTDLQNCNPYDLVVYEEGFETPDWMKHAVIYQIFPDRFYNGNTANDKAQESARGEVDYEFMDDWYILPENPEQKELLTEEQYKAHGAFYGDGQWSNEIYGGDLEGIYERIDYLKALGVNVIYLNPIFSSISSHRYDACDYTEIDPILGTLGDFEDLVKFAKENGMKIILDGVFNHVSDDSIYFDRYYKFLGKSEKIGAYPYWAYVYDYMAEKDVDQAAAEKAAKDYFTAEYGITDYSYTEWFVVNNEVATYADNIGLRAGKPVYTYQGWWGYDSMPVIYSTNGSEFQTGNWAEEIIYNEDETSVTQYWITKGNNGWRLDVANEVSDETWQEFRKSVKALDSDAVIIGEIWDDATKYLMGDMYDSVMNYVFRNAVTGFAKGDSATTAMETLEKIRERYPEEAFYAMMNLVGSHDTTRVLSYLDGIQDDRNQKDEASAFPTYEKTSDLAKKRQYLVALMQFTYAGAPTIYYGDEIGMVGSDDPDDRRAMEWGKGNKELVTWYATLAAIRAQHDVLRTGSVTPIVLNDNVMGYVRKDADEVMVILVNNADTEQKVEFDFAKYGIDASAVTDLLTGTKVTIENGKAVVAVPAINGVILSETVKTYTVDQANLAPAYDPAYIGGADLTPDEEEKPDAPKPENPKPEAPKPEDPKPEEPKPEGPVDTGDNSQTGVYVFVLVAGLAAAVTGVVYKKRKCVK